MTSSCPGQAVMAAGCDGRLLRQPALEEMRQPVLHRIIEHEPVLEMRGPLLGARQFHAVLAADGPAAHHRVRHFRVKLDRIGMIALPERLHREGVALGEQGRTARQVEALAMPLIDVIRPDLADRAALLASAGSGNSRPRHGPRRGNPPVRRDGAPASGRRDRSRDTACFPSAAPPIQSISRLMKSSVVIGALRPAENHRAGMVRSSVSGSGSPNAGRRISSGMPRLRSILADAAGRRVFLMQNDEDGQRHRRL